MSYAAEVIADNSGKWVGNALRFATKEEAADYASDLEGRWMLVRNTRVVTSKDPVNYTFKDGKLTSIGEGIVRQRVSLHRELYEGLVQEQSTEHWPFEPGSTRIWYFKSSESRNVMMGYDFCEEHGCLPSARDLKKTHVLLGSMKDSNFDTIFRKMQGENWSPNGEARSLISSKGLGHTSMSVGDVIETPGGAFFVDNVGFKRLR
jgi:hypothetical protein